MRGDLGSTKDFVVETSRGSKVAGIGSDSTGQMFFCLLVQSFQNH